MKATEMASYDINASYYENLEKGPSIKRSVTKSLKVNRISIAGYNVDFPFGVPAGLLLDSKWIKAYADMGYPILTYKTVRTKFHPCHPHPNCLFVKTDMLDPFNFPDYLTAPRGYEPENIEKITITNSFGMPSASPERWQEDMEKAVKMLPEGYILIGSGVGTYTKDRTKFIQDFVRVAKMIEETGAHIIELNFSCPNVGKKEGIIYLDSEMSHDILKATKKVIKKPLFVKVGFFIGDKLEEFIKSTIDYIDGIVGINSIRFTILDENGKPALGTKRKESGVCGWAINECARIFLENLYSIRKKLKGDFSIIGCGGVTNKITFLNLLNTGADAVLSCTGAMFNPFLSEVIRT